MNHAIKNFAIKHSFFISALIFLATSLDAQVPGMIHHQGQIQAGGAPFNGTGQFKFAFVNSTGTLTYWSNDGSSVGGGEPTTAVPFVISNGHYSLILGDTSLVNMTESISPSIFKNPEVFLRIWFSDGGSPFEQLIPDQRVTAVGYTLVAAEVEANAIGTNEIQTDAITTDKIEDDTVVDSDISGTANIAPTKISGTAWTGSNDGAGSGLNADLLDSRELSDFAEDDGNVNDPDDLVSWNQLKDVPSGFADGSDDGSGGGTTNHGALDGLGDDDHPHYFLADGSEMLAGNLQMGGNDITGVGMVDGTDISAHAGNSSAHHAPPTTLPPSGPAGGDLSGNYPNPTVSDDSHSHADGTVSNSLTLSDFTNAGHSHENGIRSGYIGSWERLNGFGRR